jgi:phage replication-related protein YjqB (UPF0714/DUF867 family)
VSADRYASFASLAAYETEGVDYQIRIARRTSPIVIVAAHGGTVEPGTSQIAASIAANRFSLYCFEGLRSGRPHRDLHITSERFDEPRALRLVEACEIAIGVHGRKDRDDERSVWLGGLDGQLRDAIAESLEQIGFKAKTAGHSFPGDGKTNICNKGRRAAGVQLELPRTLRRALITDALRLQVFSGAVRSAIERAFPTSAEPLIAL